mmetsp:Transcript_33304/g.81789  ORF Transcript_33304/g.81789 Transcript_33304/m.81789 type:complete len:402 (-) Transcript_33304:963-2168(-)
MSFCHRMVLPFKLSGCCVLLSPTPVSGEISVALLPFSPVFPARDNFRRVSVSLEACCEASMEQRLHHAANSFSKCSESLLTSSGSFCFSLSRHQKDRYLSTGSAPPLPSEPPEPAKMSLFLSSVSGSSCRLISPHFGSRRCLKNAAATLSSFRAFPRLSKCSLLSFQTSLHSKAAYLLSSEVILMAFLLLVVKRKLAMSLMLYCVLPLGLISCERSFVMMLLSMSMLLDRLLLFASSYRTNTEFSRPRACCPVIVLTFSVWWHALTPSTLGMRKFSKRMSLPAPWTPRRMMATLDLFPGFRTKYESHASRYLEGLGSRSTSSQWSSSFSRCSTSGLIRDSTVSSPPRFSCRLSALKPCQVLNTWPSEICLVGSHTTQSYVLMCGSSSQLLVNPRHSPCCVL